MRIRIWCQTSWVACALLSSGCAGSDPDPAEQNVVVVPGDTSRIEPPTGRDLQPVLLPDFSVMAESVREQMHVQLALVRSAIEDGSQSSATLGVAYGDMGNLLLAASFFEAAGICYGNAQTLLPDDRRWPY